MDSPRRYDKTFIIIALIFCIYAGIFIWRTSFVIDGERYFSLFDDAMISMRYAKHLAAGHGLVWNVGEEAIEGFTNLLWTLYMALIHLLPVAASKTSLVVQISSGICLLLNLAVIRKLADSVSEGSGFVRLGAVLVTAFYLPLNGWSLQGMEVGLLALVVGLAVLKAVQSLAAGRFSPWPYVLLAASMFVRPDMAVPFVVLTGYMVIVDKSRRRDHLVWGLVLFAGALIGQTGFRLVYFGDVFPNSYYLKLAGYPLILRLTRGLYVTFVFIWRMNWICFVIPFVLLLAGPKRPAMVLLVMFLGQLAYSIYVGGDAWESWGGSNRYVSIAMPCFFVVFFCGLERIGTHLSETAMGGVLALPAERLRRYARGLEAAILILMFLGFNGIYGPAAISEVLLLKKTLHIDKNEKMVERALVLNRVTQSNATVAVVWDGAIPYFTDRPTVSILGKNDKRIAHLKMRRATGPSELVAFYPGHLKWDYSYSIGELRPDVVVHLWQAPEEATSYLYPDYMDVTLQGFSFHLLRGSPRILWDRVWSLATADPGTAD
jgi:hypothetical protein